MANYYATTRSNYFRVKDLEAFKKWIESWGSLVLIGVTTEAGETLYGFYVEDGEGLPSGKHNDEAEEWQEADLMGELTEHLADGWVAIVMEAGAEKVRYVQGWAEAINNKGKRRWVNIHQIYALAAELGPDVSKCEF